MRTVHGAQVRAATLALLLLALAGRGAAATPSAEQILQKTVNLYDKIADYQVQVKTQVRMEGVEIPDRTATLYYKKPDKVKIESEQVILLPRQAVLYMHELGKHLEQDARVSLIGESRTAQKVTYVLKIIPKKDDPTKPLRLIVAIDGRRWTVDTMKILQAGKLLAQLDAKYVKVKDTYWLPSSLELRLTTSLGAFPGSANKGGTATVTFSNYRVNLGLGDEFFAEPKTGGSGPDAR
jgi:outer membrane lipoprotein-sorting protein